MSADAGANRPGRATIDWEDAYAFYASLPPQQRTYAAVAEQFGVSVRTVERRGREEGWRGRLAEIQRQFVAETNASIAQARVEQKLKLVRLIDASLIGYAEKLRHGDVRMTPADLDRLHRLFEQLTEQDDSQHPDRPPADGGGRSPEHVAEVLDALADSGALANLGLQRIPTIETTREAQ